MKLDDRYARWGDADCIERFAAKTAGDFFESETHLLGKVAERTGTILDVGCASGRMIELLRGFKADFRYTGIDIVERNIELARKMYPGGDFAVANGLEYETSRSFDLVNATGVCQHEPDFEALIDRMVGMSSHFVMFDVKFADLDQHLIDVRRSYCDMNGNRLFMVLLSLPRFLAFLQSLDEVGSIEIFGYVTPPNSNTRIPDTVPILVSAGVMLYRHGTEEGDRRFVSINLPRMEKRSVGA